MGCSKIFIEGKERTITRRKDGYEVYSLDRKIKYVHRFIAEKYIPNPDNKCCVNHIDGNPSNNSIDNLEWVTKRENNEHAKQNKLWGKNILEKRKLTLQQVQEIKLKFTPKKYTMKKLANEYGVSYRSIWNVINNKSYIKEYLNS
jgi:hypothetical protein